MSGICSRCYIFQESNHMLQRCFILIPVHTKIWIELDLHWMFRHLHESIDTHDMHFSTSLEANCKKFRISASLTVCPQSFNIRFVLHAYFKSIHSLFEVRHPVRLKVKTYQNSVAFNWHFFLEIDEIDLLR